VGQAPIVDGHLDLAGNVLKGRNYDLPVVDQRSINKRSDHQVMVSLPDLSRGGVALAFASIFVGTEIYDGDQPVYDPPARLQGERQLDVYLRWEEAGKVRIIRDRTELVEHLRLWEEDARLGLVMQMESADPIDRPEDLATWWSSGVRIIMPAWRRTRYAGGTRMPGGLTALGRELVAAMEEQGVILDVSHLAEESFWDALDIGAHRVIASHSTARTLCPTDRHLTDDMIRSIGEHSGVIGVPLCNDFLKPSWAADGAASAPPRLTVIAPHLEYVAGLIGWGCVGLGSDLDGGFGLEETPIELTSVADLQRIAELVPEDAREGVLGQNWIRLLEEGLPD
jgi:membrane dipeptidase